jgi:anti-anti-sigma factor
MQGTEAQPAKRTLFSVEREQGKAPCTVIFRFRGPFTAREVFGHMPPKQLEDMLHFQSAPDEKPPQVNILDLSEVPYMDSAGLGMLMTHFAHCKGRNVRMVAAGATPRVLQLFQLTKVDSVIPLAASVEEVDGRSQS